MSDPFLAEIRLYPFTFAPRNWAFCNGQLLPISQNTALFALLGTTYGGNGQSNFALPNLQGRAAMGPGQGPGLSLRDLGESGGSETVTLTPAEMPAHSHGLSSLPAPADTSSPAGGSLARVIGAAPYADPAGAPLADMAPQALQPAGGSLPHNNMQPYLAVHFCIAMQGIFPSRP